MVEMFTQLKSFTLKSKRVWHLLKKPSKQEFETISKVSGIGIAILGLIGFLVSILIKSLI